MATAVRIRPRRRANAAAGREELQGGTVVFARNRARTEGLLFRSCYRLYRLLFRTLTGRGIRVEN